MFEEMRETGFAGRLVSRTHLVPDHMGDDRRAMIGHDDDFKAVVQGKVRNIRRGLHAHRGYDSTSERESNDQRFWHKNTLRGLKSQVRPT